MDSEGIGEVRAALAAFPGLAGVAVIEHDADPAGQCLIAYIAPSDPGLDVPELHAYARKALLNGSMPAATVALDEIPVTAAGTVDTAALPLPELSGLPYQAATPCQEVLCELFAEVLGWPGAASAATSSTWAAARSRRWPGGSAPPLAPGYRWPTCSRRPRSVTWTAGSTSWLTLGSNQAKEWRQ